MASSADRSGCSPKYPLVLCHCSTCSMASLVKDAGNSEAHRMRCNRAKKCLVNSLGVFSLLNFSTVFFTTSSLEVSFGLVLGASSTSPQLNWRRFDRVFSNDMFGLKVGREKKVWWVRRRPSTVELFFLLVHTQRPLMGNAAIQFCSQCMHQDDTVETPDQQCQPPGVAVIEVPPQDRETTKSPSADWNVVNLPEEKSPI